MCRVSMTLYGSSPALPSVGNSTGAGIQWIFMPFHGISWSTEENPWELDEMFLPCSLLLCLWISLFVSFESEKCGESALKPRKFRKHGLKVNRPILAQPGGVQEIGVGDDRHLALADAATGDEAVALDLAATRQMPRRKR